MAKYVVLKDKSVAKRRQAFRQAIPPSVGAAMPRTFGAFGAEPDMPPEPVVSTESMEARDLRDMARDPEVLGIARSMPTRLIAPKASDARADETGVTWGVQAVGADEALEDGQGVIGCVLDTGIDRDHAAFAGMELIERDFTGSGNGDVQGHGTHCAGTFFGREVEGTRIGVAPGITKALIGKVLDNDGSGGSEMLFDAINWASANDAQVISMSLGFDFPGLVKDLQEQGFPAELAASAALEGYRMNIRVFDQLLALLEARAAFNGGTVVVAASGNESKRDIHPNFEVSTSIPAAAQGIVSVGALDQGPEGLKVAVFSNTNPIVSAPGVGVISAATGGGLTALNGTSMATPHVAGLAALWWQHLGSLGIPATAAAVRARLRAAARTDLFVANTDILDRGEGLARAPRALVS